MENLWLNSLPPTKDLTDVANTAEGKWEETLDWLDKLTPAAVGFAMDILKLLLIYLIGRYLIRFVLSMVKKTVARTKWEAAAQTMALQVTRIILYVMLVLLMFESVGYSTASLVAIVGSAGLSIGLAFQGTLSNFAGGVLLLFTHPFQLDDYIREDAHGNEGTVIRIGMIYTKLRTPEGKTVVVPNGTLANCSLTNYSTQGKRRIYLKVAISYQDDLVKAKRIMSEVFHDLSYRDKEEPVKIFVDELSDSAVILGGWVWVPVDMYFVSKWELTEQVKLAFDENNIHIPYPQVDVHVQNGENKE